MWRPATERRRFGPENPTIIACQWPRNQVLWVIERRKDDPLSVKHKSETWDLPPGEDDLAPEGDAHKLTDGREKNLTKVAGTETLESVRRKRAGKAHGV